MVPKVVEPNASAKRYIFPLLQFDLVVVELVFPDPTGSLL